MVSRNMSSLFSLSNFRNLDSSIAKSMVFLLISMFSYSCMQSRISVMPLSFSYSSYNLSISIWSWKILSLISSSIPLIFDGSSSFSLPVSLLRHSFKFSSLYLSFSLSIFIIAEFETKFSIMIGWFVPGSLCCLMISSASLSVVPT